VACIVQNDTKPKMIWPRDLQATQDFYGVLAGLFSAAIDEGADSSGRKIKAAD
jgi:hypothetical protein